MNITETLKNAGELALKYKHMDLYEQILSLREDIATVRESNLALRDENSRLVAALTVNSEIVRDGNCYYKTSDTKHEHPYCLACWDHDRKLVGLILQFYESSGTTTIRCNICQARGKASS